MAGQSITSDGLNLNISTASKTAQIKSTPALTVQAKLLHETSTTYIDPDETSAEISISSPSTKSKAEFLANSCKISAVRPEILGKVEFIPLVTNPNDNPSIINSEWTLGNNTEQINITSAARLLEMQTIAQNMLLTNISSAMDTYAGFDMDQFLKRIDELFISGRTNIITLDTLPSMIAQIKSEINRSTDIEVKKMINDNDSLYVDLVLEYYARKMTVKYANGLLYELSRFKTTNNKYYNIMNSDLTLLDGTAFGAWVNHRLEQTSISALVGSPRSYTLNYMSLPSVVTSGEAACNTKSFLCVLKCLARDMLDYYPLPNSVSSYNGMSQTSLRTLPAVTGDTHNDELGTNTYTGFNIANLFGSPTLRAESIIYDAEYQFNFVVNGQNASDYNKNYDEIEFIVKGARSNIQEMCKGGLGSSDGIRSLFAKSMIDITVHSNYVNAGQIAGLSSAAELSADTQDTYTNYVRNAIFSGPLDTQQSIKSLLGTPVGSSIGWETNVSVLTRNVASPTLQDPDSGLPVMPLEEVSGRIPAYNNGNYDLGPEWFFWDGIMNLEQPDSAFKELADYSDRYSRLAESLTVDFETLNGQSSGIDSAFSSLEIFSEFNNFIADMIEDKLSLCDDLGNAHTFIFLAAIRQAMKNDNNFANLYLWARTYALGEEYDTLDTNNDGATEAWAGSWESMQTKAFRQPANRLADSRAKNYKDQVNGFDSMNASARWGEEVSVGSYAAVELFYNLFDEFLDVPKTYYVDDMDYSKGRQPTTNKFRNKQLLETSSDDGLGMKKVEHANYFKDPWAQYLSSMAWVNRDIFQEIFLFEENFLTSKGLDNVIASLNTANITWDENVEGANLTATGAQLNSQEQKLVNGGGALHAPGMSSADFIQGGQPTTSQAILRLNTNRKRTYGGFNSTSELRNLAKFAYFARVIGKSTTFKLEMIENTVDLRYKYYKITAKALVAALRGEEYDKATMSRNAYDAALAEINSVKQKMTDHFVSCTAHLGMLQGHAKSLNRSVNQMRSTLMGQGSSQINYGPALSVFKSAPGGARLLNFLSKQMIASNTFSELVLMNSSKSFKHAPASDVFTNKQVKNMITYFSQPDYGFVTNKTPSFKAQGRRSILHIGIPAGMINELQLKAIDYFGTEKYRDSNLLLIEIHRKNMLDNAERTYSTPFVFDMSRFIIEDPDIPAIVNRQLQDFTDQGVENLKSNTCIYKINSIGETRKYVGTAYPSSGQTTGEDVELYSQSFKSAVFTNHMTDHYLKMYCKAMLGLDFREYVFQISQNGKLTQGPSGELAANVYQQMMDQNSKLFPDADTDISIATELDKLNRGIGNSLYFNSEKYMHTTLYPNAFDRVFSVLINERDFMFKGTTVTAGFESLQADKDRYKSTPTYNLMGKQIISHGLNTENLDPGHTKYYERYNESLQEDSAQIYNYYCTVSILPRPEVEEIGGVSAGTTNTAATTGTGTATTGGNVTAAGPSAQVTL
jgi:hypothetical protein